MYLPFQGLLIAGDAVNVMDGEINLPKLAFCTDSNQAIQSYRKILGLGLKGILLTLKFFLNLS